MLDWLALGFHALWITGLAVILASFSYHHWLAHESGRPFRDLVGRRSWTMSFAGGMVLVSGGVAAGLAEQWWTKAIWITLAAVYLLQLIRVVRRAAGDSCQNGDMKS